MPLIPPTIQRKEIMEVHHHGHVHEQRKWKEYLFQFLMLFLAVTLGFLAENQREHYIEGLRAKEYAYMLKHDMENDTVQLQSFITTADSMEKEYAFLSRIYATTIEEITFAQWDSTKNRGVNMTPFMPNDATFSLLKTSGKLRYIRDTALLARLMKYEAEIKMLNVYWNLITSRFGGADSEHVLQASLHELDFIALPTPRDASKRLKDLGYNFASWKESQLMTRNLMNNTLFAYTTLFPRLFQSAKEIILLLNKNFNLS
ncbi:MAG: hypothetical protein EOO03_14420 [Chitinophagaceae bacterium]|nr:MAG: hypothetical protein EOO03_14420 [Chitinophagaceae bacterium]